MMLNFSNSVDLLKQAQSQKLYDRLLGQLLKDFKLANIPIDLTENEAPNKLKTLLHEKVYYLIMEKFTEYLNLLYVIDVPEKEIKQITSTDVVEVAEKVAFLILKRELQKVWFKAKYTS